MEIKTVELEEANFAANDEAAEELRKELKDMGVFVLNFMGPAGVGKTEIIYSMLKQLSAPNNLGVMCADVDGRYDAERIATLTPNVVQINVGGLWPYVHAEGTREGLMELIPEDVNIIFLENVGGLISPAAVDTGATMNVAVISAAGGTLIPKKYAYIFAISDVVLINKIDMEDKADFSLKECEEYFEGRGLHLSRYEICEAYMVFGGIPYYLNCIEQQRSLSGSIDFALFNPNGPLYDEYTHLFPAMFRHSENYEKVVNVLALKQNGMTRNEIIAQTKLTSGKGLTRVLSNLERCGFIRFYSPIGTKEKFYQIVDFYVLFYHRFLKDKQKIEPAFWTNIQRTASFYQWAGTRFELLVMQHAGQIKKFLKIEGVRTNIYSLRTFDADGSAQIDAVLERADNTANLCEMKFVEGLYTIDKTEDLHLRNRIQALRTLLPKRMSIQLTFVTSYGLQPNPYSAQVNQTLTLDDLFA